MQKLAEQLDQVILPKKGKMSAADKAEKNVSTIKKARRQHSAVESAINALEHSGLDRCPDHGIEGFKRYVALGVLARNLQRIGSILTERELAELKRKRRLQEFRNVA